MPVMLRWKLDVTGSRLALFTGFILATLLAAQSAGLACDEIETFADGLLPDQELHVAEDGSDDSGDGSPTAPFATISRAALAATPGTAVVVHTGTYAGGIYMSDVSGQPTAPIWIGGAAGEERPVIVGDSEGLHLVRPSYLVLHDLEVRGAGWNGVNIDDGGEYDDPEAAHHVIVRRLWIHDIGDTGNQDGLKLSGLNDYFVIDCEISLCGGSGIDQVGCHRGLIASCHLSNFGSNAVQCKGGCSSQKIRPRWYHCGYVSLTIA